VTSRIHPFGKKSLPSPVEAKTAPAADCASTGEPVTLTLDSIDGWVEAFGFGANESGIAVTPVSAMGCPPVRNAILAISEAIGQMPCELYQRGENGARALATDHPVHKLINVQVADYMGAGTFREEITRDALLHKNGGLGLILRNGDGKPIELVRLHPEYVTVEPDPQTLGPLYRMNYPGDSRVLTPRDVIHIRAPSSGTAQTLYVRESPIQALSNTIGLCMQLERHAAKLFARGARPSGLLKTNKPIKGEGAIKRIMSGFTLWSRGNNGGTLVLEDGMDFVPVTFNSVDAQFLELRKFAVEDIARGFRVPPVLLQELGRATFNNAETLGIQFRTYTILPWVKRWESEIALKLLSDDERATYYPAFDLDELERADFQKRAEGYAKLIAARVLNPNEAREKENMPPYAQGDQFINPNTTTETLRVG
jgi:HK97 family phage portal protein